MLGRLKSDQGQLFYQFHLGDAVPEDHLVRKIDAVLELSTGNSRHDLGQALAGGRGEFHGMDNKR